MIRLDAPTLEAVRQVLQIVRLAMFVAFIAAGLRIAFAGKEQRRRAINHFLIYVLLAHLAIALPQKEAWPFSMYPMMALDATKRGETHRGIFFRVVDSAGQRWRVDVLAWSPLFPQSVMGWFEMGWPHASDIQRREAMRFLLDRAETARAKRLNGSLFFGNAAVLGPLAAPDTNLWGHAPQPARELVALQVFRVEWIPEKLAADPRSARWTLIGEYRR
jgi:hypothetical protein